MFKTALKKAPFAAHSHKGIERGAMLAPPSISPRLASGRAPAGARHGAGRVLPVWARRQKVLARAVCGRLEDVCAHRSGEKGKGEEPGADSPLQLWDTQLHRRRSESGAQKSWSQVCLSWLQVHTKATAWLMMQEPGRSRLKNTMELFGSFCETLKGNRYHWLLMLLPLSSSSLLSFVWPPYVTGIFV